MRKFKRWGLIILIILLAFVAGFIFWAETPLGPTDRSQNVLASSSTITIEDGRWITVSPANGNPTSGLILYPGGRIDPASYLPVAREIAENGYQVVIVPMPLNLAVFSPEAADQVIAKYPEIEHWAVGGHSLGGAMAARYAARNPNLVDGLVLWAAYPASSDDLSKDDLEVVSIFGSKDGLATVEKIEASRSLLPEDTRWFPIEGGNHSQFGAYGEQPGDNPAMISPKEQQAQVAQATADLLALMESQSP